MTTRAREMTFRIGRSGADTGHGHRATPAAAPRIPQLMSCFLDAVTEVAALTSRPVCPPCFAALRITVITLSYLETALGQMADEAAGGLIPLVVTDYPDANPEQRVRIEVTP